MLFNIYIELRFDMVCHSLLLAKWLKSAVYKWVEILWTTRFINSMKPGWQLIIYGVLRGKH